MILSGRAVPTAAGCRRSGEHEAQVECIYVPARGQAAPVVKPVLLCHRPTCGPTSAWHVPEGRRPHPCADTRQPAERTSTPSSDRREPSRGLDRPQRERRSAANCLVPQTNHVLTFPHWTSRPATNSAPPE
jgi:hypothetical protein